MRRLWHSWPCLMAMMMLPTGPVNTMHLGALPSPLPEHWRLRRSEVVNGPIRPDHPNGKYAQHYVSRLDYLRCPECKSTVPSAFHRLDLMPLVQPFKPRRYKQRKRRSR